MSTGGAANRRHGGRRAKVALCCSVCGSRNYETTKARVDGAEPLALKKHCKTCKQHTIHRESK